MQFTCCSDSWLGGGKCTSRVTDKIGKRRDGGVDCKSANPMSRPQVKIEHSTQHHALADPAQDNFQVTLMRKLVPSVFQGYESWIYLWGK